MDKPDKTTEGFQDKLTEEMRKELLDLHLKRKEERRRGGFRGRRGGFRGRRGGFRGRRPFRGRPMRGGRGRPMRGGRGRPPMGRGNGPRGRGNPPRGRGNKNNSS